MSTVSPLLPNLLADTAPSAAMSLLDYVRAGGLLGYFLISLSILAVALIVRNVLALRIQTLAPASSIQSIRDALRRGDIEGALVFCQLPANHCFATEVMASAIRRCLKSPMGAFEARTAVEEAIQTAAGGVHRLNNGIGVLAAVGPMLGLLGTVIGMIGAFNAIGALQGAARSTELAKFMSLALVNTAEGLIVAVPCTVAFSLFRQRIDRVLADIAATSLEPLADDLAAGLQLARKGSAAPLRAAS